MRKTYIYVLTLSALPNDKHMAITAFMAEALRMFSIATTVVARFVEAYLAAYAREEKAFLRIDRKELTRKMNEADNDRINALRVLRDGLKIFHFRKDEQQKLQAQIILDAIDLYGGADIYNQPIDSRTGNITNIVEDLETDLAEAVRVLGFEDAVQNLKDANRLFLKCQSDRNKSDAEYGKSTMADARVETDSIWRALVEEVNNAIAYGTDEDREALVPFAKYMNVEIDKYRTQTGQGVAGSTKPKPEEGDGEDGKHVTLTFEKADEIVIRLTGLTGEAYEIPELLPEHIWVKADGEIEAPTGIFPAEDCTYIEVALGKRKGAFYHYLSGEHETFYGLPGTEYTVPQIPEGCKWMPEPTGQIPEEDTQYFETLVSEGGSEESDGSEDSDGSEEKPDTPPAGEEKPKYTVNWVNKAGETVKTMEVEAGTKLTSSDYPRASSGYVWKPSWIGGGLTINGDTTIREEPDDDLGV